MGNSESNESAAVKRQAEGGVIPMYELLDLSGKTIYSAQCAGTIFNLNQKFRSQYCLF